MSQKLAMDKDKEFCWYLAQPPKVSSFEPVLMLETPGTGRFKSCLVLFNWLILVDMLIYQWFDSCWIWMRLESQGFSFRTSRFQALIADRGTRPMRSAGNKLSGHPLSPVDFSDVAVCVRNAP